MKKTVSILIAFLLALVMCACGKSEATKAAESLIGAIGEVTLQSEEAISTAEKAVAALEQKDLESLEGGEILKEARAKYEALADAAKISLVEDAINAIGAVTTESESRISDARAAYEALENRLKSGVKNLDTLDKAEADFKDAVLTEQAAVIEKAIDEIGTVTLDSEKAISKAKKVFDSYPPEVQAKVSNSGIIEEASKKLSELRAQKVEKIISEIGEVTVDSGAAINAAEQALNSLSSSEKALVSNKDVLTKAKETLDRLNKERLESALKNMKSMEDRIQDLTWYFPSGWSFYGDSWAADICCFIRPYFAVKGNYFAGHAIYNYMGYDWVFWTQMTVVADGQKFTKSYKYRDITRDNKGGKVWEYYDDSLDLDMLRTIANSKETLVRFQGDRYYSDYTVTEAEKKSIREVLDIYDLFVACGYKIT